MNQQETYPAPALARGLQVLGLLAAQGGMGLDALAQASGIPKASLLRLLNTLTALGYVARDPATKTYTALMRMIPARRFADRLRPELRRRMRELAAATGCTVEWYEPDGESMVLSDRAEPLQTEILLLARVGFRRHLNDELEAVARVALAAGVPCSDTPEYWQYDKRGNHKTIPKRRVAAMLRQAAKELLTMDKGWNSNGVRRYAAGICRGEELVGILVLAETFKPGADHGIETNRRALSATADELRTLINKRS